MARVATKPHERVLEYFRTADLAQAELVLDLAKAELKRRADMPALKPATEVTYRTAPAAKTATPKTAPVTKARKKPGPKPGSKRRPRQSHMDIPPADPPLLKDEPLLDLEEEFAHQ